MVQQKQQLDVTSSNNQRKKYNLKNDIIFNQWLAFIDDYDRGLVKMAEEKNKTIEKAKVEFGYLTGNDAVRRLEELKEKWEMDWNSNMNYVKKEAKKEGIKEGIKTGEKQNSKEIAKAMLEKNMPIDLIIELTHLSEEEIKEISESTN